MMRRLILKMSMSLDGFIAGPNGETSWMLASRDAGGKSWVEETVSQAGLHAVGRKTFDAWASYWPTSSDSLAVPMNEIPKLFFTRQKSLKLGAYAGNWGKAEIADGDLAAEITRLKQQPGKDVLAQGGVSFAQSLAASGLIDEYRLVVHPVVLGIGQSLFAQLPKPLDLELLGTTLFRSGAAAHVYRPARLPGA